VDDQDTVLIALGSNLGDSRELVLDAMSSLGRLSPAPLRRSGLWRSVPVDCPDWSPDFINAVVAMTPRPGETPEVLLLLLQLLEKVSGRPTERVRNEARTLDVDLIAWGGLVMNTELLVLPHPRAHERRFVLCPLAQVAPDFILPGQTLSVVQLLKSLPDDGSVRPVEDP